MALAVAVTRRRSAQPGVTREGCRLAVLVACSSGGEVGLNDETHVEFTKERIGEYRERTGRLKFHIDEQTVIGYDGGPPHGC